MRPFSAIYLVLAVVLVVCATYSAAQSSDEFNLRTVLEETNWDDTTSANRAVAAIADSGEASISSLVSLLAEQGELDDSLVRRVIQGIATHVCRPSGASRRRTFNAALCTAIDTEQRVEIKKFLISQLQITGDDESVRTLEKLLTDEHLGEPARQALTAIGGDAAVGALRRALPKVYGQARIGIIRSLHHLRGRNCVALLMREAKNTDESVRTAAIEALGAVGGIDAAPIIADAIDKGSAGARRTALGAYLRLADRLVAIFKPNEKERLLEMYSVGLRSTEVSLRCAALRGIARVGGSRAGNMLFQSVSDPEESVQYVALESLGKLRDQDLFSVIESVWGVANPTVKSKLLWLLEGRSGKRVSALLAVGAKDSDPEVRASAWRLQGRLENPTPDMGSTLLEVARTGSDVIRPAVIAAYLKLASHPRISKQRSIEMLISLLKLQPERVIRNAAAQRLWDLGVKLDPAHEAGFVTQWWIIGPFPSEDLSKVWPPEEKVDTNADVQVGDTTLRWEYKHLLDLDRFGVVDLLSLMKPNENVTAYLYARVTVSRETDVLLGIGNDDGAKVWVNGVLVHHAESARGMGDRLEEATAHLNAGENSILVKITQGGGDWGCRVRIMDKEGQPLEFVQEGE